LDIPELPELTTAKIVYRKQRGTVSVAFADKVNEALEEVRGSKNPRAHKQLTELAKGLRGNGDPAVALVGADLAEAVREYAESFKKLKKAALSWPSGIDEKAEAATKAKNSALEVAAVKAEAEAEAASVLAGKLDRFHEAEERRIERPGEEIDNWFGISTTGFLGATGVALAINNAKRLLRIARELRIAADAGTKAETRTSEYTERTRFATLNMHTSLEKLFDAVTASYGLCNPIPAESTDGVDVPSPNAPGKTPAPAATPAPVPTPQQPTTTTTYPATTTTTDPYCYDHPDLGRICE
jgi:hypothetical protein